MLQRCNNPKDTGFKYYGARGISVCERWHKFEAFFADVGERPPGLTLDRRDPRGNYEPSNWKWATRKEQTRNRACTVLSEAAAQNIRDLYEAGRTPKTISATLGISLSNISSVLYGGKWL